jgi:hypothetical protein
VTAVPEAWVDPDNDPRALSTFCSPWLALASAGHAQRFLSAFIGISPHLRPGRHRLSADAHRGEMTDRFTTQRH